MKGGFLDVFKAPRMMIFTSKFVMVKKRFSKMQILQYYLMKDVVDSKKIGTLIKYSTTNLKMLHRHENDCETS